MHPGAIFQSDESAGKMPPKNIPCEALAIKNQTKIIYITWHSGRFAD
jgi:hypothetical protein